MWQNGVRALENKQTKTKKKKKKKKETQQPSQHFSWFPLYKDACHVLFALEITCL